MKVENQAPRYPSLALMVMEFGFLLCTPDDDEEDDDEEEDLKEALKSGKAAKPTNATLKVAGIILRIFPNTYTLSVNHVTFLPPSSTTFNPFFRS